MWVSGHQALSALVVVGPVFRMGVLLDSYLYLCGGQFSFLVQIFKYAI